MKTGREPIVIGWTELVDLPEWGIKDLRAKVDTGARTSALHVENIEELPRGYVRFDVILHRIDCAKAFLVVVVESPTRVHVLGLSVVAALARD